MTEFFVNHRLHSHATEQFDHGGDVVQMRQVANDVVGSLPLEEDLTIYKRAMESMAEQMIHPKMTGLDMAKAQLNQR